MNRLPKFGTLHSECQRCSKFKRNVKESNRFDQEVLASQIKADRFPFPSEGDITLAVRNSNYALGPVTLHLVMKAGSVIPAHIHEGVAESYTWSTVILSTRANNTWPAVTARQGR